MTFGLFCTFGEHNFLNLPDSTLEIIHLTVGGYVINHVPHTLLGGLIGFLNTDHRVMRVTKCVNAADVKATSDVGNIHVGGIAGRTNTNAGITNVFIEHCLNLGTIEGITAGGIVGANHAGLTMNHCINAGLVIGNNVAGGVAGRDNTLSPYIPLYNYCVNVGVVLGKNPTTITGCIIGLKGTGVLNNCL